MKISNLIKLTVLLSYIMLSVDTVIADGNHGAGGTESGEIATSFILGFFGIFIVFIGSLYAYFRFTTRKITS